MVRVMVVDRWHVVLQDFDEEGSWVGRSRRWSFADWAGVPGAVFRKNFVEVSRMTGGVFWFKRRVRNG